VLFVPRLVDVATPSAQQPWQASDDEFQELESTQNISTSSRCETRTRVAFGMGTRCGTELPVHIYSGHSAD
jgi:hypothetical protein